MFVAGCQPPGYKCAIIVRCTVIGCKKLPAMHAPQPQSRFSTTRILDRNAIKILQINSYADEVIPEALDISKTFEKAF